VTIGLAMFRSTSQQRDVGWRRRIDGEEKREQQRSRLGRALSAACRATDVRQAAFFMCGDAGVNSDDLTDDREGWSFEGNVLRGAGQRTESGQGIPLGGLGPTKAQPRVSGRLMLSSPAAQPRSERAVSLATTRRGAPGRGGQRASRFGADMHRGAGRLHVVDGGGGRWWVVGGERIGATEKGPKVLAVVWPLGAASQGASALHCPTLGRMRGQRLRLFHGVAPRRRPDFPPAILDRACPPSEILHVSPHFPSPSRRALPQPRVRASLFPLRSHVALLPQFFLTAAVVAASPAKP
jgi:hypothetical protein